MSVIEENFTDIPAEIELQPGQRVIKIDDKYYPIGIGGMYKPGSGSSDLILTKMYSSDEVLKLLLLMA